MTRRSVLRSGGLLSAVLAAAFQVSPVSAAGSFVGGLSTIREIASTVPANGDLNPYGIVVVPRTIGDLTAGDVLVSNFNNAVPNNLQGTGTTIVEISSKGSQRLFARIDASKLPGRCPGGVGLTTALSVLPHGFVVVGSLPTTDGTAATARAGCLIVLDREGRVVETISGRHINGPWDMTAVPTENGAALFVTNVLNGTVAANGKVVNGGTVVRIDLRIERGEAPEEMGRTVIGSGFAESTDPAALVIGPTGLGLGRDGTLFVADSLKNRIAAIPDALNRRGTAFTGREVSVNGKLNDPLGLTIAPNGHILTVNGADGNLVETTPHGAQVAVKQLDGTGLPPGAGALFGIAIAPRGAGVYFVDDAANTLDLLR
jgi:sugar lactone lactonase YvrE